MQQIIDRKFTEEQWLPALKSGKYEKGKGTLRSSGDKYCCLGVAADLIDSEAWEQRHFEVFWGSTEDFCRHQLPETILPANAQIALARLNDRRDSFEPVIRQIEYALQTTNTDEEFWAALEKADPYHEDHVTV